MYYCLSDLKAYVCLCKSRITRSYFLIFSLKNLLFNKMTATEIIMLIYKFTVSSKMLEYKNHKELWVTFAEHGWHPGRRCVSRFSSPRSTPRSFDTGSVHRKQCTRSAVTPLTRSFWSFFRRRDTWFSTTFTPDELVLECAF